MLCAASGFRCRGAGPVLRRRIGKLETAVSEQHAAASCSAPSPWREAQDRVWMQSRAASSTKVSDMLADAVDKAATEALNPSAEAVKNMTINDVLQAAKEAESNASEEELKETEGEPPKPLARGQQGVLWFGNIYPAKAFRFDPRQAFTHHNHTTLIPRLLPKGIEIMRIVPREREGGAFVYFCAPPHFVLEVLTSPLMSDSRSSTLEAPKKSRFVSKGNEDILAKICHGISEHLKTHDVRAPLSPTPVRAHRVQGSPYLEDIVSRYPSARLRVKIDPPCSSVTEEMVYAKLRRFGQVNDLEVKKEGEEYQATFLYTGGAIAARHCLHRSKLDARKLNLDEGKSVPMLKLIYEPYMQRAIRQYIWDNFRYVMLATVAAMVAATYIIWDPLRVLTVQIRIAMSMLKDQSSCGRSEKLAEESAEHEKQVCALPKGVWGWCLRSFANVVDRVRSATLTLRQNTGWMQEMTTGGFFEDFWEGRPEEVRQLKKWINTPQDRLMLLTGDRGNGRAAFVRWATKGTAIQLDVASMLEGVDDNIFLRRLSRDVGYWPAPIVDRQLSLLLDALLPGASKMGRKDELLSAVQRVLFTITTALEGWRYLVAPKGRSSDTDSDTASHDYQPPLIIIQGFTPENKDRRDGFFAALMQWAAYVSEKHLARVLVVASPATKHLW
eukprot:TRINITY_DN17957_c0_g1_i2.p1 TRINITY_DN17957_c0_g1~~TRINITY_DN17957_c0_g1_i2.p1  ORF type:complete len:669 (-),score=160.10 TRINITY_DN17957_c0_g1_i2:126-2132(-)